MVTRVRKAVFPVAGLGTRLLPATKSIPKEMITIVDRPLIQYAVDEAREAGIEELIFVTGRGKSALVDYFDQAYELEATLNAKGKGLDVLGPSNARFGEAVSVRQQQALGAKEKGAGGEIQLTDAIARLIGTQPVHGYRFHGLRYDCGSAAGFVIANLAIALERDDVGPAVREFLSERE